jgi:hypothetical protein
MNHDIPDHLIPAEETVIAASDEEKELNKTLETDRWVFTEKPDDGLCPYCGCEYESVSWASRTKDATKGVCPYDTSISDFIVQYVHSYVNPPRSGLPSAGSVQCFCGPAYDDELLTYPVTPDYDIKGI